MDEVPRRFKYHSGTLVGDELKLARNVGDFGTEQLTAKRAEAAPAK
jgi:hypothetical protein